MTDQRDLVRIPVDVVMSATSEGGRMTPIRSGFRPLCYFGGAETQPIGLCELELVGVEQLEPGNSARAILKFDAMHRDLLKDLATPGVLIGLGDGPKIVGSGVVLEEPA